MWSVQSTTGEQPPGLSHHTLTLVDPHRAVVFGGIDGQRRVNTTYVLDLDKWVCIAQVPAQIFLSYLFT